MENVRQTMKTGLIIGTLSEKSTEIKQKEYTREDGTKGMCNWVEGDIVVSTKNGDFKLRINQPELTKADKTNNTYASMEKLHNTYISAVDAAKNKELTPDNISVKINLGVWDRYNNGKILSTPQIRVNAVSRDTSEKESQTDCLIEGVIRSIKPEITPAKNDNEEATETGRLVVEIISVSFKGEAEPFTLIVPEDLTDAFMNGYVDELTGDTIEGYSVGDTCCFGVELLMKHIGAQKAGRPGFGRKANISEGFDVLELSVFNGEPPYTEDVVDSNGDSKVFTMETMKALMTEREMKLKKLEEEGNTSNSTSVKGKGVTNGKKGLGGRKPNVASIEGMDGMASPF